MMQEMEIDKEKGKEILKALIYQEIVDEANKEAQGKEITQDKPLIMEFVKFCGLSEEEYDNLYEKILDNFDEFENNNFWDDFAEKIAIVKREKETESKGIRFSKEEAFKKLCGYMDEINDKLEQVDQVDLWKHIAQYFK